MANDLSVDGAAVIRGSITDSGGDFTGAFVIIDDATDEVLRFSIGLDGLLALGALSVIPLSGWSGHLPTSLRVSPPTRLVLMLQRDVTNFVDEIRRLLEALSHVEEIGLLTGVPDAEMEPGLTVYGRATELLEKWGSRGQNGEKSVSVSIQYLPLQFATITPNLYMLPGCRTFSDAVLGADELLPAEANDEGVAAARLSEDVEAAADDAATALRGMLDGLCVHEEIYTLGPIAARVAAVLSSIKPRKQVTREYTRAGLVLIDRAFDLVAPLSHPDSLFDRVAAVLPRRAGGCDVEVPLAGVLPHSGVGTLPTSLPTGSIAQPNHKAASALLQSMIVRTMKESQKETWHALTQALKQERITPQLKGQIAGQLPGLVAAFQDNAPAFYRHNAVIQVAAAAVVATQASPRWEELMANERMMSMMALENNQTALRHLATCFEGSKSGALARDEALALAGMCMSFLQIPTDDSEADALLQSVLASVPHKDAGDGLQRVWEAARRRGALQTYRSLLNNEATSGYVPLLRQVVESIFDASQPGLPDLKSHTASVGSILKSGLSRFLTGSRPRPNRHPIVFIVVLGGITATEIRAMTDAVAQSQPATQVIIVSDRFISCRDAVSALWPSA